MQFKAAPNNLKDLRRSSVRFNELDIMNKQQQSKLEKDIKSLEIVCASQFDQLQDQHEQIKQLNENLVQKDIEIEKYKLQEYNILQMREVINQKEQIIVNQEIQIGEFLKKIQDQADEILELKKSQKVVVEVKQCVLDDEAGSKESLLRQIALLEQQLKEKQHAIVKLQEAKRIMKKEYEQQLAEQMQYIEELEQKIQELEQQLQELQQEFNRIDQLNRKYQLELDSLKSQLQILTKAKELDSNEVKYMIEITNQRNNKLHLQQQIAQMEYEMSELRNSNSLLIEKLKTAELNKHRQEQLKNEVIILEKDNEKLKSKNRQELYQIEQQIQEIKQKEQELLNLKYELELKQINLHQSIKYTQGMKEENQQLQQEIEDYKQQLKELRILYEEQTQKHEEERIIKEEKIQIEKIQANQRLINQIPQQIVSPYQLPNISRHYLK